MALSLAAAKQKVSELLDEEGDHVGQAEQYADIANGDLGFAGPPDPTNDSLAAEHWRDAEDLAGQIAQIAIDYDANHQGYPQSDVLDPHVTIYGPYSVYGPLSGAARAGIYNDQAHKHEYAAHQKSPPLHGNVPGGNPTLTPGEGTLHGNVPGGNPTPGNPGGSVAPIGGVNSSMGLYIPSIYLKIPGHDDPIAFPADPVTGQPVDPGTGQPVDPNTGEPIAQGGIKTAATVAINVAAGGAIAWLAWEAYKALTK